LEFESVSAALLSAGIEFKMANPLEGYESVAERIEKFWNHYLGIGRIDTELVFQDGNRYVVKAYGYREITDLVPFATGWAEEVRSGANRFPLENAETSAIGRMLHNAGISKFSENENRPSYEEMRRVGLHVVQEPVGEVTLTVKEARDPWTISEAISEVGIAPDPDFNTPKCSHGYMIRKSGISSKTGNPYDGWTCTSKDKNSQCKAIWLEVSK
jgi:hypothetical protein